MRDGHAVQLGFEHDAAHELISSGEYPYYRA
jgi:hypothetical protein